MYVTIRQGLGQVENQKPPMGSSAGSTPLLIKGNMPVIFFQYNSTELRHDAKDDSAIHLMSALSKIRDYLERRRKKGQGASITLHGFASVDGEKTRNINLSEKRAARVKELLVAADIDPAIISVLGHGVDSTFQDRTLNRRVAFELLE